MKKLFILLFIAATFSMVGHSQAFHYDVNGDGSVTVADVTAIYDYLLGNVQQHEYVDLSFPSGTLWATTNVGAETPEDYGDYFAWGETTPKDYYYWSNYQWCNGDYDKWTKYCTDSSYGNNGFTDYKTELDPEDDAATVNWGPQWRMPSKGQILELLDNCTTEWTTRNGVNGRLFTSNHNGASLFLPAAGHRFESSLYNDGSWGSCWSRTLRSDDPIDAYNLKFNSGEVYWCGSRRGCGFTVRAVRQNYNYDVNGDGSVTVADVTAIYDYLLGNVQQHGYVDLGLPSGTLWATMNVGASRPEDYGDYFAWGMTTPNDVYDWSRYKWGDDHFSLTKYCTDSYYGLNGFTDSKTELDPEDDAATVYWGPQWRMPSSDQIQELLDNCTTEWTTKNGVNGRLFTSNINGESLFLPAAGYRGMPFETFSGSCGQYWSSTLISSYTYDAWCLQYSSGHVSLNREDRAFGLSVRAVRVP